jgi:hypothetical protein
MQYTDSPVSPEIVAMIERTIREVMTPYGYRGIRVRPGEDHDGWPVIFVEVDYDLTETPIDFGYTKLILSPLRDKMWEAGERRFPYIRHRFHERQPLAKRTRAKA